jgi:DNA polymerase (family 10)/putative hydrolase
MGKYGNFEPYRTKGDWHIHTSYTDGENGIREYCQKATENGLKLLAFTEHVRKNLTYSYDDFLADVYCARKDFGIELIAGCEAKVTDLEGTLDVADEVLQKCDIVVGVFHSFKWQDKRSYLTALEAMLRNQAVQIWGHPMLFAQKHGIRLSDEELNRLIDICLENNVLIERNLKYDLPGIDFIKLALSRGVRFVIGSDAHSTSELLTGIRLKREWDYISGISLC